MRAAAIPNPSHNGPMRSGGGLQRDEWPAELQMSLVWGESTWMNVAFGTELLAKRTERSSRHIVITNAHANGGSSVHSVGHHVYADAWKEFNRVIQQILREEVFITI